jgi:hypothetical protein
MSIKNPVTPSGIELATLLFVAECLNHYATAYPNRISTRDISWGIKAAGK